MKRIFALISLLIALALCMTGCVQMRVNITVDKNGQVDMSILYAVASSMFDEDDEQILDAEEIAEYEKNGYTCEAYSQDGYSGFILSKNNVTDFSDGILNNEASLVKDGKTYILDIPWNTEDEDSDAASLGMAGEFISSSGGFAEVVLTLPVEPSAHNATAVSEDGKTLTWNLLEMDNRESIHAEFSPNSLIFTWIIRILLGVAALAIAFVAIFYIRKALNTRKGEPIKTEFGSIDQLREYKSMLDEGLISQEDYEAKKAEILHLTSAQVPSEENNGENPDT